MNVLKYTISSEAGEHIQLVPEGAIFMCVKEQGNKPVMYFLGDFSEPKSPRKFLCAYTGNTSVDVEVSDYLGTVMLGSKGELVCHYFGLSD